MTNQSLLSGDILFDAAVAGEFETGCHTVAGNNIVLFVQSTYKLHEVREQAFERAFLTYPNNDTLAVNLLRDDVRKLYAKTIKTYCKECGCPETELYTYLDFLGCCFRDYFGWKRENRLTRATSGYDKAINGDVEEQQRVK